ncbi:Uu.00g130440.m01.CDS01 [Anthostomella pinea]|uniref:Uu.00g130440.m01.CDS01 n=1 Tax=Anthostomella pinea TaxID=933095 RepID=A0AAI8VJM6_9PEZI|nr:Uu.00g130440.m01.CDS01 [Anthostomella pinea]
MTSTTVLRWPTPSDEEKHASGRPATLLHKYSQALRQKESSSIGEISHQWAARFPKLRRRLIEALEDTLMPDSRASRHVVGPCDMFHFEVALDLYAGSTFPNGSKLRGIVDLATCQPRLPSRNFGTTVSGWKPSHLQSPQPLSTYRDQYHTIRVPFPDDNWEETFAGLAEHIATKHIKDQKRTAHKAPEARQDAHPHTSGGCRVPSAMQLLSNVAMYQEVWSAQNDGSGISEGCWTRRAVIVWTFAPVHQRRIENGKAMTGAPGTTWQFLTELDPLSQYYQQHAYRSRSLTGAGGMITSRQQYVPPFHTEQSPSTTCAVAQEQPEPQPPDEFASVETQALLYPCGPSHFLIFNDDSFPTGFSDTYIPDISAAMPWNNGRNPVWDWDPLLDATLGLGVPWCSGYNSEANLTMADSTGLIASYIQAQSQGQKRMSKEHDAETTIRNGMGAKRIHLVLSMP